VQLLQAGALGATLRLTNGLRINSYTVAVRDYKDREILMLMMVNTIFLQHSSVDYFNSSRKDNTSLRD
jgi:hypothetical protein